MSQSTIRVVEREIRPHPPYDFRIALTYLATSPSSVLESVDPVAGTYHRALTVAGRNLLISLRSTGSVADPRLLLHVHGDHLTAEQADAAVQHVERIFLLARDPAPFLAVAARDPVLNRLVQRYPGVRPLLVADPYEALLFAIIGQQVNVTFARKLKLALVHLFNRRLHLGDLDLPLLPLPSQIAALDPEKLTSRQFSRRKASYLIDLSQAVASGQLDLEAFAAVDQEDAIAALTCYRGIGRWTAEYVLMRGLGAPDSIPAADLGLRKIIGPAYGIGRTASEDEVRGIAQQWAGWRGWAAFLWWLELQTTV